MTKEFSYRGLPPNFVGWISKHVWGKKGDPNKENNSYRIFICADGKYGLQETDRRGTSEREQKNSPWRNRLVKISKFDKIVKKHVKYTDKHPFYYER